MLKIQTPQALLEAVQTLLFRFNENGLIEAVRADRPLLLIRAQD